MLVGVQGTLMFSNEFSQRGESGGNIHLEARVIWLKTAKPEDVVHY